MSDYSSFSCSMFAMGSAFLVLTPISLRRLPVLNTLCELTINWLLASS